MLTIPNTLSLLRAPLALLFLQPNTYLRLLAIFLAMLSDALDGFIARRNKECSHLGSVIDPLMDKVFVLFVLGIFYSEQQISIFELSALMSRDCCIGLFILYLGVSGLWSTFQPRAPWCGKLTTFFQFIVLVSLTLEIALPVYIYNFLFILGPLTLTELYLTPVKLEAT